MEIYIRLLEENPQLQKYHDILVEHTAFWMEYATSGVSGVPGGRYLVSLCIAVFVALALLWIFWRLVSWPFRKKRGRKKQDRTVSLHLPEGYDKWPDTLQDTYLKAELFIAKQVQDGMEPAREALAGLGRGDNAKALHLLGDIRDTAQKEGDRKRQINAMRFTAALLFPGNISAARQTMEDTVAIAPDEPMIWLEYADILLGTGARQQALPLYDKALELASRQDNIRARVHALSTLGKVHLMGGDTEQAETCLLQSLKLLEQQTAGKKPDRACLGLLAKNNLVLASVLQKQKRLDEAGQYVEKTLEIKRALLASAPSDQLLDRNIALVHIRSGDLLMQQKKYPEALSAFNNSAVISQTLADQKPDEKLFRRDLAVALHKAGKGHAANNSSEEAQASFVASLALREALFSANSQDTGLKRDLAIGHTGMGAVLEMKGHLAGAENHFVEAVRLSEELVRHDNGNRLWQQDLSSHQRRLASLQQKN